MTVKHEWVRITEADPAHSARYAERFRSMAAAGNDLAGEARMIDAMAPRRAHILDAGCGPGRVGGFLAAAGHQVVGVDIDPVLIAIAEQDHPGPRWIVGDLAEMDLAEQGVQASFDAIVCAGNVMTFLHPDTRVEVLRRLRAHLADGGRLVIGFGAGRGYDFADFFDDVATSGLEVDLLLSTWDLRRFNDESGFLVAILRSGPTSTD